MIHFELVPVIEKTPYAVLNALQEAVFILDNDRKVKFANDVADRVFGEKFIGLDFIQVVRHPDCVKTIDLVANGQNSAATNVMFERPVKALFKMLASDIGSEEILVSFLDISDLREAEQMRSDFVANVSHELRSPLTSIAGFIETLQGPAYDDEAARTRFLELMDREAKRMVRLISDLLSLSKVEANMRVRPQGSADIVAIAKQVQVSLEEQAANDGSKINIHTTQPNHFIPGNSDELTQVLQNLIENALKYGAPNTAVDVTIGAKNNVAGISGDILCVEVRDHGEGIAGEHIGRLTERFYRVDAHRSRDMGGTGLGLAIVKHIVNHHRGRVHIESEVGVGSTFSVFLPTTV